MSEEGPAARAGVRVGDKLLEVSSDPLALWQGTAVPSKVHVVLIFETLGCPNQNVLSSPVKLIPKP